MATPLRILIVEDSEDDALLLVRELTKGGYDVSSRRVETAEDMKTALAEGGWDAVVSDYTLPHFSGLSALEVLMESGQDLPFIIVSGNIGEDIAVKAMRAGAHDYLIKGNLKRLGTAVERELRDAEVRRERRRAEADLSRLNRLYLVLSKVNEAIVRIHDPQTLYEKVCRICVEEGLFKMAWIGVVDEETLRVRPAASHGDEGGYLDGLTIIAADVPEGNGPTGRAIVQGRHFICGDIELDPIMQPWRDKALGRGFRSSAAFPLHSGAKVLGALTVYANTPRFFTGEEINLLSSLAGDISFALETMANESKRREAEQRTEITNRLLKLFAQKYERKEFLDAACALLRTWSTCRHIGIRISGQDGTIPFESCEGYDESFLERESGISLPLDRCICTRIVAGRPEPPDLRAMTPGGSFCSGNTTRFTKGLKEEERALYCGVCLAERFDSLAVIPIRHRGTPLGAIHLADDRKGLISESMVEFIEQLAYIIGEAVFRFDIEDNLKRASAYNRRLIEASLDPLVTISPEGKITDVNAATEMATGVLREELVGTDFSDYFTDPGKAREGYRQAFREGKVMDYALELRHRDGRIMPVLYNASLYRDESGKVLGLFAAARDMTELTKAEEERARLASAVEFAADAVVITDPERGTILYVNSAFERVTGYSREEAVGRDLHILDSGKHDEAFFRKLRETLRREGVWTGRLINRKKDGTHYFEDCTYSPVRNLSGEVINYVAVKRDVTEKIRLESIAESVSTMNSIGYVFSGVRHEIGNPINTVKMLLSVLQMKLETAAKETVAEYLSRAMNEVARVEHLLRSLKSFNLFETPELETVDTAAFLDRFLGLITEDLGQKGILLTREIGAGAERMFADPRGLQQVLLNIVANAVDALEDRPSPRIDFRVRKQGGRALLQISDNGRGMTGQQLQNLFKPFYTSKPKGTGLGLVIVKKMLALMNGDIEIASSPGQGTTITISLPEGTNAAIR